MTDRVEPVYNIEVAHDHCYRVGESGVLVHNQSTPASCSGLPSVSFSLTGNASAVAEHIRDAQAAGHPKILRYDADRTRRNNRRSIACPQGTCSSAPAPNNSCDEYPFASTHQGGSGASTRCVPTGTNSSQGGTLRHFYPAICDGAWFCVEVVP